MTRFCSFLLALALAVAVSFAFSAELALAAGHAHAKKRGADAKFTLSLGIESGNSAPGGGLNIELVQAPSRKGGGACLTEQQIATAIASGEIRRWAVIRNLAGIPDVYYETSDVQVCVRNGAPFYIVNMVSPKGENVKYVLNALDGTG